MFLDILPAEGREVHKMPPTMWPVEGKSGSIWGRKAAFPMFSHRKLILYRVSVEPLFCIISVINKIEKFGKK